MDGQRRDLDDLDDLVALSLRLSALAPRDPALSTTRIS